MLNKFQQGTIIYGMKSSKYTECATYAVIISARCDIANSKISKMYYLTAVDAMSWFNTEHAAYNLLYLTSSRAKYRLLILGSSLNGISSCLEHSIESKYLDVEENK